MHTSNYLYHHGQQELHGYLAHLEIKDEQPRPAVLVAHDWSGRNDFACEKTELLARMGYVALALDMYGQGRTGVTVDEKMALMEPLAADRKLLRERIRAAFDALIAMPEVDASRVAAIGFCFGGMCVLDLARSGAEVKAVVSFHGLLNKPDDVANQPINARILALHGYDDPMVKPPQVDEFCREMTEAKADWQVHQYGNTQHGFTNPRAQDPKLGTVFNPQAAARSWLAMSEFLKEALL